MVFMCEVSGIDYCLCAGRCSLLKQARSGVCHLTLIITNSFLTLGSAIAAQAGYGAVNNCWLGVVSAIYPTSLPCPADNPIHIFLGLARPRRMAMSGSRNRTCFSRHALG